MRLSYEAASTHVDFISSQDTSFEGNQGQKCQKGRPRRSSLNHQAKGPNHRLLSPTKDPPFGPFPEVPQEVHSSCSSYGPIPGDHIVGIPLESSSAGPLIFLSFTQAAEHRVRHEEDRGE